MVYQNELVEFDTRVVRLQCGTDFDLGVRGITMRRVLPVPGLAPEVVKLDYITLYVEFFF